MQELEELATPIGDFILSQTDIKSTMTANGAMYHYADVCTLMNRLDKVKKVAFLKYYAVRSKDGKFFRSKGYDPYGNDKRINSWVDDIKEAKLYKNPGPAKAIVTYFSTRWPQYGIPEIVELGVTNLQVFEYVRKEKKKKK